MKTIELLPPAIDIAMIGGGPQALTLATHLLQKRPQLRERFWVFEPSGSWMRQWQHQFAAFQIPHLRSPAVHHPDPDPYALRRFAESRPGELHPPYDLPGTGLFEKFCADVIQRWQLSDRIIPAKVAAIAPPEASKRPRFRLDLQDGRSLTARRVILATGSSKPHLPPWVNQIQTPYPPDRLCHSGKIDLRRVNLAGETVLIIGGGLTSGHLAVGAIQQGARVMLMYRRRLQEKLFDADPGWLGPKYLKDFWAEPSWENRFVAIQAARNGGSMTPGMMLELNRMRRQERLNIYEECQVVEARWQEDQWLVRCEDGIEYECSRIWIATGNQIGVTSEPLLQPILQHYSTEVVKNLPVLDQHLRIPGCEFFVMGGLAALQIGPVARNLFGAKMASERIVPALSKPSLHRVV